MTGAAEGGVKNVLRLEGLCVFVFSLFCYANYGSGWVLFLVLFFVPDLSFVAYVAGPKVGAVVYNILHSYAGAVLLVAAGITFNASIVVAIGLIWTAHIGFDRALAYGLKYSKGFGFTHLGLIGKSRVED